MSNRLQQQPRAADRAERAEATTARERERETELERERDRRRAERGVTRTWWLWVEGQQLGG